MNWKQRLIELEVEELIAQADDSFQRIWIERNKTFDIFGR